VRNKDSDKAGLALGDVTLQKISFLRWRGISS